jgi:hypothetical protein
MTDTSDILLTTKELAERWKLKEQTLNSYRYENKGVPYFKINIKGSPTRAVIRYKLNDIIEYENKNRIIPKN